MNQIAMPAPGWTTTSWLNSDPLKVELQNHVKSKLQPYKYPRWIEFVDDLPKTVTGKIQRFRLRS